MEEVFSVLVLSEENRGDASCVCCAVSALLLAGTNSRFGNEERKQDMYRAHS